MSYYNASLNRRRTYGRRSNKGLGVFVVIMVFSVLFVGCLGARAVYQGTERTVDTHIIDKERVCNSDGCEYLVFTEAGTFKLVDSTGLLSGETRFNTSDTYGRIKVDEPATLRVIGWRIGFFSQYPNILEITQE